MITGDRAGDRPFVPSGRSDKSGKLLQTGDKDRRVAQLVIRLDQHHGQGGGARSAEFVDWTVAGRIPALGPILWEGMPVSIKPIRLFGDPVLRTPAEPVIDFDAELRRLVADLTDTMRDAPGVGLAAPQIGVALRVFTYFVDDELGHLINPDLDLSADEESDDEGCLSFPGLAFPTNRAFRAVAKGFNMHGEPVTIEGSGLLARCVQHETDHLDGILFIDRLDPEQRKLAMKEIRAAEWWGEQTPAVKVSPHLTHGKAL
jgi:peptide deformylase